MSLSAVIRSLRLWFLRGRESALVERLDAVRRKIARLVGASRSETHADGEDA